MATEFQEQMQGNFQAAMALSARLGNEIYPEIDPTEQVLNEAKGVNSGLNNVQKGDGTSQNRGGYDKSSDPKIER